MCLRRQWEGGTRVVGLVSGFGIYAETRGKQSYELFYCADWLPTLVGLAMDPSGKEGVETWRRLIPGGEPQFLPDLGDGLDNFGTTSTP